MTSSVQFADYVIRDFKASKVKRRKRERERRRGEGGREREKEGGGREREGGQGGQMYTCRDCLFVCTCTLKEGGGETDKHKVVHV